MDHDKESRVTAASVSDADTDVYAASQRALDATVVIIAGDDDYGSGTLLRSERHTAALTAWHVVKNGGRFSLLFNGCCAASTSASSESRAMVESHLRSRQRMTSASWLVRI